LIRDPRRGKDDPGKETNLGGVAVIKEDARARFEGGALVMRGRGERWWWNNRISRNDLSEKGGRAGQIVVGSSCWG